MVSFKLLSLSQIQAYNILSNVLSTDRTTKGQYEMNEVQLLDSDEDKLHWSRGGKTIIKLLLIVDQVS